jgi:hypothetical protein
MKFSGLFTAVIAAALATLAFSSPALAQNAQDSAPIPTLVAALSAACRANPNEFADFLTAANASAFRALPEDQRAALLKRFSLANEAGKPLLSADQQNHPVLRCSAEEGTAEFRIGEPRTHDNLSFIPVTVVDGEQTDFGLVREDGRWRLLSLGLVLLDVSQLSKQWAEEALSTSEQNALNTLRQLADAIQTYRRAYGKLPDELAQLGPAPKGQIAPDQASLVDAQLAAGTAGGYQFRYRIVSEGQGFDATFELAAMPSDYGKTGLRSFLLDASGKIHGADHHGSLATSADPIVE